MNYENQTKWQYWKKNYPMCNCPKKNHLPQCELSNYNNQGNKKRKRGKPKNNVKFNGQANEEVEKTSDPLRNPTKKRKKSKRRNQLQNSDQDLLIINEMPLDKNKTKQVQTSTLSGAPISQPGPMPSTSHSSQPSNNNINIAYDTRLNMARASAAAAAAAAAVPTRQMHQEQQQQQQVPRQPIYSNMYYPGFKPTTSPGCLPPADVRIKRLPFYDIMGELVQPSILTSQELFTNLVKRTQETMVSFNLNSEQASELSSSRDFRPGTKIEFQVQVQLRLCLVDALREQDDAFPPGLCIKVNGKPVPLPNPIPTNKPNMEPRRPPRPLNITPLIKISPVVTNNLQISWTSEPDRHYAIVLYLVRKLSSMDLLSRLKTRGSRHMDYTRGLIKDKLSEDVDCDIATTSLRVSLTCPLGKMRMTTPCRASTCNHLQCFDAMTYLQMNERKPTWLCPVCDKPAIYDNLTIDGYFQQVLESPKSSNCADIQLNQDGTWSPLIEKKKGSHASESQETKSGKNDSDDLVVISPIKKMEPATPVPVNGKIPHAPSTSPPQTTNGEESLKRKAVTVVDLTFSSDEEDEAPNIRMISSSSGGNKHEKIAPNASDSSGSVTSSSSVLLSGGSTRSAPTPASVTSSGYVSPSIITLDSPSPPATPQQIPPVLVFRNRPGTLN